MKKLLILLFSIFLLSSPSVFADDTSDFSIEGISIGDSLLDYMTEDEILESIEETKDHYYHLNEPHKYAQIDLNKGLRTYDWISVLVKNNSTNDYITNKNELFTIKYISGFISFEEKFDDCIIERDKLVAVLSKMFPNANKREFTRSYKPDDSGNSVEDKKIFDLKGKSTVAATCVDLDETYRLKGNFTEGLRVAILPKEINDWLSDY